MLERIAHREEAITGERAANYGAGHRRVTKFMHGALLKDIKKLNVSGHCLEVGAGPGLLATIIAEDNADVEISAVDLSPDMVRGARDYIEERGLSDRIRYVLADAADEEAMHKLGQFDFVYTTLSLHHWKKPERSMRNLWHAVKDDGVLYIQDLKRVWWLYYLPVGGGFFESIKAAYLPKEIGGMLKSFGVPKYQIKTTFPGFMQSVIAWK